MENQSEVHEFILLSLTNEHGHKHLLFLLFLFLYIACLLGNGTILVVILAESWLHTPMYFFLANLSCLDIFYSTVTVPRMLSGFLVEFQCISFVGCIAQMHFFHFLGSSEAVLLSVMALDRYVAICNPLRYTIIMNKWACLTIAFCSWISAFFYSLTNTVMTSQLQFCGPNHIQHFFCDIRPLLQLACSNTDFNLIVLNATTACIALGPFLFILISYLYIITFLFSKVQSWRSRWKAFSTCASHLTVVAIFLIPVSFNYIFASVTESTEREMSITVLYSAVTPVLNPLIYTLRNQEVISAMRKILYRKWLFGRI
uniref:Olfactory receptor n=1 Tax=Salvator merianae TaxID=96440 RepID=A0A8D0E489_SALMN